MRQDWIREYLYTIYFDESDLNDKSISLSVLVHFFVYYCFKVHHNSRCFLSLLSHVTPPPPSMDLSYQFFPERPSLCVWTLDQLFYLHRTLPYVLLTGPGSFFERTSGIPSLLKHTNSETLPRPQTSYLPVGLLPIFFLLLVMSFVILLSTPMNVIKEE